MNLRHCLSLKNYNISKCGLSIAIKLNKSLLFKDPKDIVNKLQALQMLKSDVTLIALISCQNQTINSYDIFALESQEFPPYVSYMSLTESKTAKHPIVRL